MMKKLSLCVSALLIIAMGAAACGDDDADAPRTIADHVRTDDRLSSLGERLIAADLLDGLDQSGPLTLFAPTNEAFALLAQTHSVSTLAELVPLLTYHIHDGERTAAELERTTALTTQHGSELHVRFGVDGVLLNDGVKLVTEEIVADNGIIHVLDAVLVRPLVTTTKRYEVSPDQSFGPGFVVQESTITVDDVGFVHDLRVFIDIEHTNMSTLFITLETGSASIPLLLNPSSYGNDARITLADSASFDVVDDIVRVEADDTNGQAFVETTYRPLQPLEFQLGNPSDGAWVLRVLSFGDEDSGRIVRWGFDLTSGAEPPAAAIVIDTRVARANNPQVLGRGFNEAVTAVVRRVGDLQGDISLSANAGELTSGTRMLEQERTLGSVVLPVAADAPIGSRVVNVVAAAGGVSRIFQYDAAVAEPDASNMVLLAHVPLPLLGAEGRTGNDIWGWTDPLTGAEIAIVGTSVGTAFVDISVPTAPMVLGTLPTETSASTWRDVKVYQDHAFIVSEARDHGLQVFDLTRLRDVTAPPQTFVATAHSAMFGSAHNIAINEDSGFAYVLGSDFGKACGGGVLSFDISTPTLPVALGCFGGGLPAGASPGPEFPEGVYVHDAQCVTYAGPDADYLGREICITSDGSAVGANFVGIADFTDQANVVQIARVTYPAAGYAHQGWLTEDHQYFILNDEFDEFVGEHNTRSYVWDMRDLDAPVLLGSFDNPRDAIGHNTFVSGNIAYQANYTSGLRMVDVSAIATATATEMAFYDTYPDDDALNDSMASCRSISLRAAHPETTSTTRCGAQAFQGAWSNYPYFASGVIVVSDTERGLFILSPL